MIRLAAVLALALTTVFNPATHAGPPSPSKAKAATNHFEFSPDDILIQISNQLDQLDEVSKLQQTSKRFACLQKESPSWRAIQLIAQTTAAISNIDPLTDRFPVDPKWEATFETMATVLEPVFDQALERLDRSGSFSKRRLAQAFRKLRETVIDKLFQWRRDKIEFASPSEDPGQIARSERLPLVFAKLHILHPDWIGSKTLHENLDRYLAGDFAIEIEYLFSHWMLSSNFKSAGLSKALDDSLNNSESSAVDTNVLYSHPNLAPQDQLKVVEQFQKENLSKLPVHPNKWEKWEKLQILSENPNLSESTVFHLVKTSVNRMHSFLRTLGTNKDDLFTEVQAVEFNKNAEGSYALKILSRLACHPSLEKTDLQKTSVTLLKTYYGEISRAFLVSDHPNFNCFNEDEKTELVNSVLRRTPAYDLRTKYLFIPIIEGNGCPESEREFVSKLFEGRYPAQGITLGYFQPHDPRFTLQNIAYSSFRADTPLIRTWTVKNLALQASWLNPLFSNLKNKLSLEDRISFYKKSADSLNDVSLEEYAEINQLFHANKENFSAQAKERLIPLIVSQPNKTDDDIDRAIQEIQNVRGIDPSLAEALFTLLIASGDYHPQQIKKLTATAKSNFSLDKKLSPVTPILLQGIYPYLNLN